MKIAILGIGCTRCEKLYAEAEKAVATSGVSVELEKINGNSHPPVHEGAKKR